MLQQAERSFSVTARQASAQLSVHVETVKRWARTGKVPARKNLAGQWLFAQDDINSLPVHEVRDDDASLEAAQAR
ncbi:MAG: helix-turn-helix domain-containing protein [Jiangellaceae bacterium]